VNVDAMSESMPQGSCHVQGLRPWMTGWGWARIVGKMPQSGERTAARRPAAYGMPRILATPTGWDQHLPQPMRAEMTGQQVIPDTVEAFSLRTARDLSSPRACRRLLLWPGLRLRTVVRLARALPIAAPIGRRPETIVAGGKAQRRHRFGQPYYDPNPEGVAPLPHTGGPIQPR